MKRGALILSGGKSSRMGRDKGIILLMNKPLVSIIAERLNKMVEELCIVISKIQNKEIYEGAIKGLGKVILEEGDLRSPLVGIYYGLKNMVSDYVAIIACDLPLVNLKVIDYMFDKAINYDACIPIWENGKIEPLHAIYNRKKTLKASLNSLRKGELDNRSMIKRLEKVHYISVDELRTFDKNLTFLFNVNTKEELEQAKNLFLKGY